MGDPTENAPRTSIRPKTRGQVSVERLEARQMQEAFGDMEFEQDIVTKGYDDPLVRLGFGATEGRGAGARIIPQRLNAAGAYAPDRSRALDSFRQQAGLSYGDVGDVYTTGDLLGSNTVWSHELRHRGLTRLRDTVGEDIQGFIDEYLSEGSQLSKNLAGYLFAGGPSEEALVDFMDRKSPEEVGFPIELLSDDSEGKSEEMRRGYAEVESAILRAAEDMRQQLGSPPTVPRYEDNSAIDKTTSVGLAAQVGTEASEPKGFFQRIFGYADGGLVSKNEPTPLMEMSPRDFNAALRELAQQPGVDIDFLMREYNRINSVTGQMDSEPAEGRRSVGGGFFSKREGSTGMDALRSLEFEPRVGLVQAAQGTEQVVTAPARAARGTIPADDMTMEALGIAGLVVGGGAVTGDMPLRTRARTPGSSQGTPYEFPTSPVEMLDSFKAGLYTGVDASAVPDVDWMYLAETKPHPLDNAAYTEWMRDVTEAAEHYGVDETAFMQSVNDLSSYFPRPTDPALDRLTTVNLPRAAQIGVPARSLVDPDGTRTRPPLNDSRAGALGFDETVYHTTTSGKDFDTFDLDQQRGGMNRPLPDLLGPHVGTARAAAERYHHLTQDMYSDDYGANGLTMEMRARTDTPADAASLGEFLGLEKGTFGSGPLSEENLRDLYDLYNERLPADLPETRGPNRITRKEAVVRGLRSDLAEAGFTHIPYINDVEDVGSVSYIMLTDRGGRSPAVLRNLNAAFDPERVNSPNLNFDQGGLVEYAAGGLVSKNAMSDYFLASAGKMTEMEFVGKHKMSTLEFENKFAEDNNVDISGTEKLAEINTTPKGVKMDYSKRPRTMYQGGQVQRDPVSGNEVPPGSAPVNVRDDIPAMLSEGEYIVPADVLKYFGVNFFEELRMKAKEGMMNMEQEGRTGGAPTSAPMQARPQEGPPRMAKGGVVETTTPTFDPTKWQTPGMSNQIMGSSAYTYVEYFGPNGESQMILHVNGEPAQNIPTGYSETPPSPESPSQGRERRRRGTRPTPPLSGSGQTNQGPGLFSSPLGELDFTDPESVESWAADKLETTNLNAGLGMAGVIGGAASAALELRHIAEVSAAAKYYESIGNQDASDRLMDMADDARAEQGMIGRWSESFSDGDRIFENYRDSLGGNSAPAQTPTAGPSSLGVKGGPGDALEQSTLGAGSGSKRKSSTTNSANVKSGVAKLGSKEGIGSKPYPSPGPTSRPSIGTRPAVASPGPTSRPSIGPRKETTTQKLARGGGFNKGGLVARPKK